MWSLALLLVYVGFYLFIVFLSLSIACGLYYLAELIEEFTITTKRILGYAIRVELLLHLLLLIDRLPLHCLALGFGANISYISLLKRFPYMQLTSTEGLTSIVALLASTVAWVNHYRHSYYTVEYIISFLLVTTWLIPFTFFLSMAGDQAVLPGAGGYPYSSPVQASSSDQPRQKQHRGLALRIFDVLRQKRDQVLPDVVSKLPAGALRTDLMPKEKI